MIEQVRQQIQPLNPMAMEQALDHLNHLTKPLGSLGRLEQLSIQLAGITGQVSPVFPDKRIVVMAADHGVVTEGVSAFPQEVTQQMVRNFVTGGAAINVLARQTGAQVVCVDVGVAADLSEVSGIIHEKVAAGTQNMCKQPAMTGSQVVQAIEAGIKVASQQIETGANLLATGEMGIGNTTASSAVLAALSGYSAADVVGRGTGISDASLKRKIQLIQQSLEMHQPKAMDPVDILQKVGGFEIAALAGLVLGSAANRIPVVIDGFISTVAALCAVSLSPNARFYLIPSHQSVEPGHQLALRMLELEPVLQMNMRLGEGTGAALMFPLIDSAQRIMSEMATFQQAGVTEGR